MIDPTRALTGLFWTLLSVTAAAAQGDTCSTGAPLAGVGGWSFDTRGATTSGFDGGGGCAPGASAIVQDIFWVWTVPATGAYSVTTCDSNFNTRLSVHLGSHCGATCVGHGNNACLQSSYVGLPAAQAGDVYLIQVGGNAHGPSSGTGALRIAVDPCPTAPDDGLEDNDTCATALPLAPGVHAGLFASLTDPDHFALTLLDGERLDVLVLDDGPGDLVLALRDSACVTLPAAPLEGLLQSDDALSYTNASGAPLELVLGLTVAPHGPPCAVAYELRVAVEPAQCEGLFEDAREPNDDCTSALPLCDGFVPTLLVSTADEDYYALTVPAGGSLAVDAYSFTFGGIFGDVELLLYDALAPCALDQGGPHDCAHAVDCDTSPQGSASVGAVNASAGPRVYLLEVRWLPGLMSCGYYDLDVSGTSCSAGGVQPFCADAAPHCGANSGLHPSGPARIGAGVFDAEELHLEVTDGPAGEFGYLLVAATTKAPGVPVASGVLCLVNPIGRYAPGAGGVFDSLGRFDSAGRLENLFGTSRTGTGFDVPFALPSPPGGALLSGSSWSFQCWYRCGTSSSFSDGVTVTLP
jgi:hypothetical protein